jgi:hypothetical protein
MKIVDYLTNIKKGKIILWCYLIWYIVIVSFYFDSDIQIWINSVGICIVIGVALILSVSGKTGSKTDKWQIFRLFAMPFCVSSFSSLIKGHEFIIVVPPNRYEQLVAVGACAVFVLMTFVIKSVRKR